MADQSNILTPKQHKDSSNPSLIETDDGFSLSSTYLGSPSSSSLLSTDAYSFLTPSTADCNDLGFLDEFGDSEKLGRNESFISFINGPLMLEHVNLGRNLGGSRKHAKRTISMPLLNKNLNSPDPVSKAEVSSIYHRPEETFYDDDILNLSAIEIDEAFHERSSFSNLEDIFENDSDSHLRHFQKIRKSVSAPLLRKKIPTKIAERSEDSGDDEVKVLDNCGLGGLGLQNIGDCATDSEILLNKEVSIDNDNMTKSESPFNHSRGPSISSVDSLNTVFSNEVNSFSESREHTLPPVKTPKSPKFSPKNCKFIDFFKQSRINAERYTSILELATERNLNLEEIEKCLATLYQTEDIYSVINNGDRRKYHILKRLTILCYLVELGKFQKVKDGDNSKTSRTSRRFTASKKTLASNPIDEQDYKRILYRFPILETSDGVNIQVRSSCGVEHISSEPNHINNSQADELLEYLLEDPHFFLSYLQNLKEYEIYKTLLVKESSVSRKGDKFHIKRPLNCFMLYRAAMLRCAIVIELFSKVDELINHYFLSFLKSCFNRGVDHLIVDRSAILDLIELDLITLIQKASESTKTPTSASSSSSSSSSASILITSSIASSLHKFFASQTQLTHSTSLKSFICFYHANQVSRHQYLQKFTSQASKSNSSLNALKATRLNHTMMCHTIALCWLTEDSKIKAKFATFGKIENDVHKEVHPNYKYRPTKLPSNKSQTKGDNNIPTKSKSIRIPLSKKVKTKDVDLPEKNKEKPKSSLTLKLNINVKKRNRK